MKSSHYSTRVKAPDMNTMNPVSTLVPASANDGLVLKPVKGRSRPDMDRGGISNEKFVREKFVKRKSPFIVSTFNVQTLSTTAKKEELAHEAELYGVDVICLQEHRIVHSETLLQEKIQGYTLITSSAWRNARNAANGGVGLLMSPRALKSCIRVEKFSDRILKLSLTGNPEMTVICCYSPHNDLPESDVIGFYQDLSTVTAAIPAHNMLYIPGDFNAKLGPDDARFTCNSETNRNGKHLKDFMEHFNLVATNTRFENHTKKLWTHKRPNSELVQLDYILARKKWVNSIKNARAFNSFEGVKSDHRIVSCKSQISYRQNKAPTKDPIKGLDWKRVVGDDNLKEQFTVAVHNRFNTLCDELEDKNISVVYDILTAANREVALEMLPKKKRRTLAFADSEKVNKARDDLKSAAMKHRTRHTRHTQASLDACKYALDEAYTDVLEAHVKSKTEELDSLHHENKHGAAWVMLRELTDKKATPVVKIKGDTSEERLNNWFDHFNSLLGKPNQNNLNLDEPFFNQKISDTLPIQTGPFTMEELQVSLKRLKTHKTPGPDNISSTIWKCPLFHKQLLEFCNETYKGNKPAAFSKSYIIPLPKKGDLQLPQNYRGITLSPLASKIYNSMLLNRITPHIDPILRRNQNGFRQGRSTLPQILALRRIIEELRISKRKAAIVFVDFSKAFDSVNRKGMLHILLNYGVPDETVKAIAIMYDNPSSSVQTMDGLTKEFLTTAGILQGDTLAPFLFVIVTDYILRQSLDQINEKGLTIKPRQSRRYPSQHVTDLDYADDLAITADILSDAQDLLTSLEHAAAKVGLQLNAKKTEYMTLNEDGNHQPVCSADGTQLKEVNDFKYLGSFVADSKKDFQSRKGQAWNACNKLHVIWQSGISRSTKLSFFRACVESILLYGSETWTMKKDLQDRLDGTYTRLLMRVQNISWREHKTKAQIYGDIPPISVTVAQRRARFAGHCYRAKDQVVSDIICWRLPCPNRGRRPFNYMDTIARSMNLDIEDIPKIMAERGEWRCRVNSISASAVT